MENEDEPILKKGGRLMKEEKDKDAGYDTVVMPELGDYLY